MILFVQQPSVLSVHVSTYLHLVICNQADVGATEQIALDGESACLSSPRERAQPLNKTLVVVVVLS